MRTGKFVLVAFLFMFLASCAPASSQGGIVVTSAEVRLPGAAMPGMSMGNDANLAGYMVIKNTGSTDDSLIGAQADFAMAMLHETTIDANQVATMKEVSEIPVPAGQTVELKTGGYHIMFMNPTKELKVGDMVSITLKFKNAGTIMVQAKVVAASN